KSGPRSRQCTRIVNLFGDLQKADPRNGHHAGAHDNERKTYKIRELLAWDRNLAPCQGGCCDCKKKVELFDQKTECQDGDSSSHPSEKCALIGGMIAEVLDHRCSPVLWFDRQLLSEASPMAGVRTAGQRSSLPKLVQKPHQLGVGRVHVKAFDGIKRSMAITALRVATVSR